jgi:hypothetical protein
VLTVEPGKTGGLAGLLLRYVSWRQRGFVPGITRLALVDVPIALAMNTIYNRLQLRRGSSLSRLQREMLATVVNGAVGGAP